MLYSVSGYAAFMCCWKLPTSHFFSSNYKFVAFKCSVVGKIRHHGGHSIYSCLFLGKILLKPKGID